MANEVVKSNSNLNFSRQSSLKMDASYDQAKMQFFSFLPENQPDSRTTSEKLNQDLGSIQTTTRAYERNLQELEGEVRGHIRFQ